MITASLQNYRISPRKVRVVADMIRGKKVSVAKALLEHAAKKGRHPIATLIDSAVANASHNFKIDQGSLMVKEIRVDQGFVLKRSTPMSRGSAFPIKKRTSHISVVLAPLAEKKGDKKPDAKRSKNTAEAAPAN